MLFPLTKITWFSGEQKSFSHNAEIFHTTGQKIHEKYKMSTEFAIYA